MAMTTVSDGDSFTSRLPFPNSARVKRILGVLGPVHSSVTIQVANLLGLFHVPQVNSLIDIIHTYMHLVYRMMHFSVFE